MAAIDSAPASEHVQTLLQSIKRYDIGELLDAAATFQDWLVISNDEKKEIEKQSSKQESLDRLIALVTENGRITQFANFILRFNSPIQDAALAVTCSMTVKPKVVNAYSQIHNDCNRLEKTSTLQQHAADSQSSRKSSDTNLTARASTSPMEVDTTDSLESCSMDIGSKVR